MKKLESIVSNVMGVAKHTATDLIWAAADFSGTKLQYKEKSHHTFDSLFTKPANITYIANLVYLNTFADFVGISAEGFPPKDVINEPVDYYNSMDKHINFRIIQKSKKTYELSWNSLLKTGWRENDSISAELVRPKNAKDLLIAVNGYREPNWMFQKKLTEGLLKKDCAVLYLPLPFHIQRNPKRSLNGALMINYAMPRNAGFAQFRVDILTAVDHLSNEFENISYVGTSLGAIMGLGINLKMIEHNEKSSSKFKEFKSFISIVGGIDIPSIIKESTLFKDYNHLINKNNMSLITGYDPGSIKISKSLENMYAVIAKYDTVVPTEFQEKMVRTLKVPESNTLYLPIGHSNIFFMHKEIGPMVTSAVMPYKQD